MESSTIALSEGEARAIDEDGNELYIDIDITRNDVSQFCNLLLSEENGTAALAPKTASSVMCVLKNIST